MFSRIYNYGSLGKVFKYHLINRYSVVDHIAGEKTDEYEVTQDFTLKMIGKNSKGGSIFELIVTAFKLPTAMKNSLTALSLNFIYDYQRITEHVVIILKDSGEIVEIDNINEIKFKWDTLKARLLLLPPKQEINELLENGELQFGDFFGFSQSILLHPFYTLLFPAFHNQFINTNQPFAEIAVNSFIFPEVAYQVECNLSIKENSVLVESELEPENLAKIRAELHTIDPELDISTLFYKSVTEYILDNNDHIKFAEAIQIETVNGSDEVINHFTLTLV
jgi:hypothetical protein